LDIKSKSFRGRIRTALFLLAILLMGSILYLLVQLFGNNNHAKAYLSIIIKAGNSIPPMSGMH
jgi:hypothetical protein